MLARLTEETMDTARIVRTLLGSARACSARI